MESTDFAVWANNSELGHGIHSNRKIHVHASVEGLTVVRVNQFAHSGQIHWAFSRLQAKNAIGLVRPNHFTCLKVPFPMTNMRDTLGLLKFGVAFFEISS